MVKESGGKRQRLIEKGTQRKRSVVGTDKEVESRNSIDKGSELLFLRKQTHHNSQPRMDKAIS